MNISSDQKEFPSHLHVVTWFSLSIATSVGGSVMLILLLASSVYHKKLAGGSTVLIAHLMLIQLLHCAVLLPILTVNSFTALTHRKDVLQLDCSVLSLIHITAIQADNWASLFLAINRYVAIVVPHFYRKLVTRNAILASLLLPWLIGVAVTLPVYFGFGGIFLWSAPCAFCAIFISGATSLYGAVFWPTLGTYVPIILMGMIYLALFGRLAAANSARRRSIDKTVLKGGAAVLLRKQERQIVIAKMLVAGYVWYSLCILPGPIILTVFPVLHSTHPMLANWINGFVTLCAFAASPFIFLALSSDYRSNIRRLVMRQEYSSAGPEGRANWEKSRPLLKDSQLNCAITG
ncbi:hypothetical protein BV898_08564 [Hypsibius exemplaris]|uniref:G-protein coupled receptors family 1 profile domain-containing protein n=1 Tax=Hypsibius exemplaris TaxID=2072580 RepID=A0A1W0WQ37_HYPEX|nr:hypothetical protein BV898_08564 [Hypsibius exemplaris]